jgi:hypothetical protein
MKKPLSLALLLFMFLIGSISCKKSSVTFNGRVINTTGRPVSNASISVDNSVTGTTDASGNFSVNVSDGSHVFTLNAPGYTATPVSVSTADQSSTTHDLTLLGSANIQGIIIDSQTGLGLSGATVNFSVDGNAANVANAELVVTSNSDGTFTIQNGPVGAFYCIIVCNGYFTRTTGLNTFVVGANALTQQTVVSRPAQGSVRIILTWGSSPADLDSHLTGPSSSGGRFHVFWDNQTPDAGVNLDVDDVTSYGPETTTISILRNGLYRYSVHNYSEQGSTGGLGIANSPAIVEVYSYNGLLNKFTAPAFTGTGNAWRVFEMTVSGTNANIVTKNVYVLASSDEDLATFKGVTKNAK